MNKEYQNSPTPSQSWIVENLCSLISNQEDGNSSHSNSDSSLNNDCTLTLNDQDLNQDELVCDAEVENARTRKMRSENSVLHNNNNYSSNIMERIPKRPFSPEEIQELTPYQQFQMQMQNKLQHQFLNDFDNKNYFSTEENSTCVSTTSASLQLNEFNLNNYYSDCNNKDDNQKYQHIHSTLQPMQQFTALNDELLNENQINGLINHNSDFLSSPIKRKKLNRTPSNLVPSFLFTTYDQPIELSFKNEELNNYHHQPQQHLRRSSNPTLNPNNTYESNYSNSSYSNGASSSSFNLNESSLSSVSSGASAFFANQFYAIEQNKKISKTSSRIELSGCVNHDDSNNNNNSNNENESCTNSGFYATQQTRDSNLRYYNSINGSTNNKFYNSKIRNYYFEDQENQREIDYFKNNLNNESRVMMLKPSYSSIYLNESNRLIDCLDDSLMTSNKNVYNKRMTKSSSTHQFRSDNSSNYYFSDSNKNKFINSDHDLYNNKNYRSSSCFPHSVSHDGLSSINKQNDLNFNQSSTVSSNSDLFTGTDQLIPFFDNHNYNSNFSNSNKFAKLEKQQQSTEKQYNNSNNNSSSFELTSSKDTSNYSSAEKDQIVLHVKNLDYKISSDEWKRILLENFRKHCKETLSVNVITNPDKSLLGIVKLTSKDDARLAISCLHHKKIGYKRLNVNIASSSSNSNSPKSKIVALLKTNDTNEMALTRFIELYCQRYNQTITLSELFKFKDIVHISPSKDGQGRQIKLLIRNFQNNLENEMQDLLHAPYCSLHSHQKCDSLISATTNKDANGTSVGVGWLPNVIVSLRTFKSAVHKLLNDHGGQMPLLSFLDCYKCCIFNENSNNNSSSFNNSNNYTNNNNNNINRSLIKKSNSNNNFQSDNSEVSSYQLIIDNENGVSLEHLITCAQDVQIQYNESFYKQLQWENDKSKPVNLHARNNLITNVNNSLTTNNIKKQLFEQRGDQFDNFGTEITSNVDDSVEESQRKINQLSHEVVELLKGVPRCIIPLSKFNNEYHKKYGRQCRVADYGYTKLYDLLESIPHILQILDSEFEKKLTLTHRVQVRRFSNDLIKVFKSHTSKKMFAAEYPLVFEKHFVKTFDIRDYGVCFLEDMLAELPESIICRKEIEGRTFIQIPKITQMEEERLCMNRLTYDIIDMLKQKPRFSIQFNKFIPNFHHHFGRQCKLSHYGFTKLIELLEAIPETVQILVKDSLQFVQLKKEIMLDLITQNLVKLIEESNYKICLSLAKLEEFYNSKYQAIYYKDFDCENFSQLYSLLPLEKYLIKTLLASSISPNNQIEFRDYIKSLNHYNNKLESSYNYVNLNLDWLIQIEILHEKELKRVCKLMLKKLMDNLDDLLLVTISDYKLKNKLFYFQDLVEFLVSNSTDLSNYVKFFNKRGLNYVARSLYDFFSFDQNTENSETQQNIIVAINGLSELYFFAKQIRNLFKVTNLPDMTLNELEMAYRQAYNNVLNDKDQESNNNNNNSCPYPYKKLGFIDANLLFSQGLNLLLTIKKYNDKRISLNKEFWPISFLEIPNSNDSLASPISPNLHQSNIQTNANLGNNLGHPSLSTNDVSLSVTPLTGRILTSSLSTAIATTSISTGNITCNDAPSAFTRRITNSRIKKNE